MMNKCKKYKSKAAILLFSLSFVLVGCGSEKRIILQPTTNIPLSLAQRHYEQIPKPVAYEGEPPEVQTQKFREYLKEAFNDIDTYKRKLNSGGKRYGKNRLTPKPAASARTHAKSKKKPENIEKKLYPAKLDHIKPVKSSPLYGA